MKAKGVGPSGRLLDSPIRKATIENRLLSITSLPIPIDEVRIIKVIDEHALAVGCINTFRVAREALRMRRRLARAIGLSVAGH